ncbi:hypothetical protein [Saccharopolyspora sp. NPDC002376]
MGETFGPAMACRAEDAARLRPGRDVRWTFIVLGGLALSSVAISVAEPGDESQLMAMTFETRYRAWQALIGDPLRRSGSLRDLRCLADHRRRARSRMTPAPFRAGNVH